MAASTATLSIAFSCPHIPSCALQTAREHMSDMAFPPLLWFGETIRRSQSVVNGHSGLAILRKGKVKDVWRGSGREQGLQQNLSHKET
jgi:hypothetical protein